MRLRTGFRDSLAALVGGTLLVVMTSCRDAAERRVMAQVSPQDQSAEYAGSLDVTLRRLWAGPRVSWVAGLPTWMFSSVSPDGRYLSTVDWSTIDLAVRDLETGDIHRLTNAVRGDGRPYEDAGVSLFSPDGQRILYAWQFAPDVQLRMLDFVSDGTAEPRVGEPELVFHNPQFEPYFPFDWSPDGSQILAKVWMGGDESHTHSVTHLALISTMDGTYRALKSFDWREPMRAAFSPDGRFVAYDLPPQVDSPERDLYVVALDGSSEQRIVESPAVDRLLDWHPDGGILFQSDRDGTPGIWRVPMADGRPEGPPELLKADIWGVEPLGSGEHAFYYGVDVEVPRLYSASLDLDRGIITGTPTPISDPTEIQVHGWDWSPRRDYLAYSGQIRGAAGSLIATATSNGEQGESVRVDLEATDRITWSPDGTSVIVSTMDSRGRPGFFSVELASGSVSPVLLNSHVERSIPTGHFALSPDGATLFFGVVDPEKSGNEWLTIVAHDLESGEQTDLAEAVWPGRISRSPGGASLAVVIPGPGGGAAVGVLPVSGGKPRVLYELPAGSYVGDLEWTPDGRSIAFLEQPSEPGNVSGARFWVVDLDGGEPQRVDLGEHLQAGALAIHPDGRHIAYRAGQSRGEVWVMEGLGSNVGALTPEDSR
jgi:Tol biopolymer transport system component